MIIDTDKEFRKLQDRINRAFEEISKPITTMTAGFREPLMDIIDKENKLEIRIDLPGMAKEDINIDMTRDMLTIKAKKKSKTEVKGKNFYKAERSYKGFYRSLSLPAMVIPEKAKATYKDGLLTITVPKAEKKNVKKVKVE